MTYTISGAGGGKGGGGSRAPVEAPNTLRSRATARVIDLISEGEIKGLVAGHKSLYFDGTPLEADDGSFNFQNLMWTLAPGLPDQAVIPGFAAVETEDAVGAEVTAAASVSRAISDPETDAARVTLRIPGLSALSTSNGDLNPTFVDIAIDLQAAGGGFVTVVTDRISGKAVAAYERAYRIELPKGLSPWTIRVRRVTPDSTSSALNNKTFWASLTRLIDDRLFYPDSALIALAVDAEAFGGRVPTRAYEIDGLIVQVPSNYDPATRTYTGIWNGSFKRAWSDNPAWALYDLLTSRRYGLGERIDTAAIDKASFYEWARFCDESVPDGRGGFEPRFTFNAWINADDDPFRLVQAMASAGRALAYWGGGTIYVVPDAPKDPVKLVTPANVIDGLIEYEGSARLARHNVVLVRYLDAADGFRPSVEVVEDPDAIRRFGRNPTELAAFGCTRRSQARRAGLWVLETEKSEDGIAKWRASLDHADLAPGDIVSIADPAWAGARFGGRLKAFSQAPFIGAHLDAAASADAGAPPLGLFSRASSATYIDQGGVRRTAPADWLRKDYSHPEFSGGAWLFERAATNFLLNSAAPATQSVILAAGTYTLWLEGTGSAALSGAAAGVAAAGAPLAFTLAAAGGVTVTRAGIVTAFQLEDGALPSSFIATAGAAVTRQRDIWTVPLSAFAAFNPQAGTLHAEFAYSTLGGVVAELNDNSLDNRMHLANQAGAGRAAGVAVAAGATQAFLAAGAMQSGARAAAAFAFAKNDFALSLAGGLAGDAAGAVASVTQLRIGAQGAGGSGVYSGHIGRIAYFPLRIADADLQELTATPWPAPPLARPTQATLDAAVALEPAETYDLTVVLPDGSLAERRVTSAGATTDTLALASSLPFPPQASAMWVLTASNVAPRMFRVISIEQAEKHIYGIVALRHDPTKYARVEQGLMLDAPPTSLLPTGPLGSPGDLALAEFLFRDGPSIRAAVALSWTAPADARIRFFEAQIMRPETQAWEKVGETSESSLDVLGLTPGVHGFRVRGLDALGRAGPFASLAEVELGGLSLPPSDVLDFAIAVLGDIATLTWTPVPDLDLAHYRIKFSSALAGAAWEGAVDLLTNVATTTIQVPALVGTYLIKAVDIAGVESANATAISTATAGLLAFNVVSSVREDPGFLGAKLDCLVTPQGLQLDGSDSVDDWPDWDAIENTDFGLGGFRASGLYNFAGQVDLGAPQTARVCTTLIAGGSRIGDTISLWTRLSDVLTLDGVDPALWSAVVEMRVSDDPATPTTQWSAWRRLMIGDHRARTFQFRLRLASRDPAVTPVVTSLAVRVDMPDRNDGRGDIACPPGGLRVDFAPRFRVLQALAIDGQDLAAGDRYVVSNKSASGFDIRFLDAAGTGVARGFDYLAKGYGAVS